MASPMLRELVPTPGLGNTASLLSGGREAVVVDPPRDAWRVIAAAESRGWRITHVVETHVHNDYLSGALELRSALGAEILAPGRGRYAFAHRPMDEGDTLEIDGLRLTALSTPGHTPEHLAWEIATDGSDGPAAVATGGSLLVGSAGRTDLLGADRTDELTRAQFRSLRALAALPDDVVVLPTHGAGSFCSVGPADTGSTTTIGRERRSNPLLAVDDEERFRTTLLDGLGPYPRYYAEMGSINRAGPPVVGRLPDVPRIDVDAVRAAIAGGAHVVDARSRREFAAGHIRGSQNIELGDSFASYVGWFVPFGAAVVLVLPDPVEDALVEATTQLFRIGYDRIVGRARRRRRGVDRGRRVGVVIPGHLRAGDRGRARERLAPAPARRPLPAGVARRRHRPRRDRALDRRPRGPARDPAARRPDHRDVQDGVAGVDRREHARRRRVRRAAHGRGRRPRSGPRRRRRTDVRSMTVVKAALGEASALALDATDRLAGWRERFLLPPGRDGRPKAYLAGMSLGAQPRRRPRGRRTRARPVGAPRRRGLVRRPTTAGSRPTGGSAR